MILLYDGAVLASSWFIKPVKRQKTPNELHTVRMQLQEARLHITLAFFYYYCMHVCRKLQWTRFTLSQLPFKSPFPTPWLDEALSCVLEVKLASRFFLESWEKRKIGNVSGFSTFEPYLTYEPFSSLPDTPRGLGFLDDLPCRSLLVTSWGRASLDGLRTWLAFEGATRKSSLPVENIPDCKKMKKERENGKQKRANCKLKFTENP